jgi:predicted LPLAT superfamily acyltransferase
VAVQGDRVLTGVSPVTMQDEGRCFQIPRGPLVLAEIARVPCYPIFLERLSCMHYRIHVGECFYDGRTKRRADDLGKTWLSIMHQHLQQHWQQWFVFEPLVTLENPRS